ncbi:MAG TPA: hypothetical protein VEB43_15730 [Anaeromyxobacter sp.]|nr:hypothetical protein [Anaeromyxobacter sp.]
MDAPVRLRVEPARAEDEPALRRLLREAPLRGRVTVSLEREPSFELAAAVEGDRHDVLVARAGDGAVVGLACRSVRTALVNGAPARVGYLGQLRLTRAGRASLRAVREGFARLAAARRSDELPFDFTSIVSDNAPARRLLEAGVAGLPTYRRLGELATLSFAIPRRAPPAQDGLRVVPGTPERLEEIAAFLRRHGGARQLAACPTAAELASPERARGLAAGDFLLVERGGTLLACGAIWDQRGFKQTVVRGYAPLLAAARPVFAALAALAPALGLPALPRVGAALPAAFLAFVRVADGAEPAFAALLDAALRAARARRLGALVLGLGADDPLLPAARRRPHVAYRSTLYAVHGADGARAAAALDGRPLGPEVATL